jgi:hypothetical protein
MLLNFHCNPEFWVGPVVRIKLNMKIAACRKAKADADTPYHSLAVLPLSSLGLNCH